MAKFDPKHLPAVIPDTIRDPSPNPVQEQGQIYLLQPFRWRFYAVFEGQKWL